LSQPTPTWLKLVQTVGADLDERAAEVVGKGVGDGQGLPAGLVGSEELFRMIERRAALFRVVRLPDGMIYDYVSERSAT